MYPEIRHNPSLDTRFQAIYQVARAQAQNTFRPHRPTLDTLTESPLVFPQRQFPVAPRKQDTQPHV